eukprot:6390470-Amphidinium_carterae.1
MILQAGNHQSHVDHIASRVQQSLVRHSGAPGSTTLTTVSMPCFAFKRLAQHGGYCTRSLECNKVHNNQPPKGLEKLDSPPCKHLSCTRYAVTLKQLLHHRRLLRANFTEQCEEKASPLHSCWC